jgi:hypothetical protein
MAQKKPDQQQQSDGHAITGQAPRCNEKHQGNAGRICGQQYDWEQSLQLEARGCRQY